MKAEKQKKVILPPTHITEEQMSHLREISASSGEAVSTIIRAMITSSMNKSSDSLKLTSADEKCIESICISTEGEMGKSEAISEGLIILNAVLDTPNSVRETMFDSVLDIRNNLDMNYDYSLIRNMTTFLLLGK